MISHQIDDLPIESRKQDLFDHQALARTIADEFERDSQKSPSNIAVFGPWGSGKSSVLGLLKAELHKRFQASGLLWISFDAWAYQTDDTLVLAILHELLRQAEETSTEPLWRIALATGLSIADLVLKIKTDNKMSAKDIAEHLERVDVPKIFESKNLLIEKEFKKVVGKLRGATKSGQPRRIVLAIDNLDRCTPDVSLRVLETLFLISKTDGCSFVIAVDQHVLISFLNRNYQGTLFNGTRYLEKVFPIYYRVPDPYVCWEFEDAQNGDDDQVYAYLKAMLPKHTVWNEKASSTDEEEPCNLEVLWHYLAQPRVLRNPRRIKRVVRRIREITTDDDEETNPECVLFLVILSDIWPEAYEFLLSANDQAWQGWVDYMAGCATERPGQGVLFDDQEFRDFFYQIRQLHEPDYINSCPIRDSNDLLQHVQDATLLGL